MKSRKGVALNPNCPICGTKLKRFMKETWEHPYQTFKCPECKILFFKRKSKKVLEKVEWK